MIANKHWSMAVLMFIGLALGMAACDASNFPTIAVQVNPLCVVLAPGETANFDATVFIDGVPQPTADPEEVTWSVSGGDINGVISSVGDYVAPDTVPPPASQVTIIATSTQNSQKQGQATVILTATPDPSPNPCAAPPFSITF